MPDMPLAPARLWLPRRALAACIFMAVERDTRGHTLAATERFNHYPASPLPTLSWTFTGRLHMVEQTTPGAALALTPALPRLVFAGPQRRPRSSWSPGAVHALTVSFYPEALGKLLGVRMGDWMDRIAPLEDVAPAQLVQAFQSVHGDDGQPVFAMIEDVLAARWRDTRAHERTASLVDWVAAWAPRLAFSAPAARWRHWQRQVRRWTGQSHRELERFARQESLLKVYTTGLNRPGSLHLAALATDAGYADQSHMGREVRHVTGFTPGSLHAWIDGHESFWLYRLLSAHHAGAELKVKSAPKP